MADRWRPMPHTMAGTGRELPLRRQHGWMSPLPASTNGRHGPRRHTRTKTQTRRPFTGLRRPMHGRPARLVVARAQPGRRDRRALGPRPGAGACRPSGSRSPPCRIAARGQPDARCRSLMRGAAPPRGSCCEPSSAAALRRQRRARHRARHDQTCGKPRMARAASGVATGRPCRSHSDTVSRTRAALEGANRS